MLSILQDLYQSQSKFIFELSPPRRNAKVDAMTRSHNHSSCGQAVMVVVHIHGRCASPVPATTMVAAAQLLGAADFVVLAMPRRRSQPQWLWPCLKEGHNHSVCGHTKTKW